MFFVSTVRFYLGNYHHVPNQNSSIKAAAPASPYKHLSEQHRNVVENISHRSCTRNGGHVGLLMGTGRAKNERMISQIFIRTF